MTTRSPSSAALLALLVAWLLPALAVAAAAVSLQPEHTAVTRVRAVKSNYHWTISNYTLYKRGPGDFFESPMITTHDEDIRLNWTVLVYPRGNSGNGSANGTDDSFGVYLVYTGGDLDEVRVRYTIHLLNADDEDFTKVHYEQVMKPGVGAGLSRLLGTKEIVDPANRLLPNDELRIFVEFLAFVGDRSYSGDCQVEGTANVSYSEHLERYLGNFEYSDLTLSAEDSEFRAHRVLLAARSRVFDEIFKNYGTGHAVLKFTMDDFSAEAVAVALRYMYTGRIGKMTGDMAAELLTLAYKYAIEGMREIVLEELCLALDLDPEERDKALEEIEYDAVVAARRLPIDAQKACSIVPIDLSQVYEIE